MEALVLYNGSLSKNIEVTFTKDLAGKPKLRCGTHKKNFSDSRSFLCHISRQDRDEISKEDYEAIKRLVHRICKEYQRK